jgi:HEAT repeat protein
MNLAGNKRFLLICGIGLVVLIALFFLTRSGTPEDPDPELARIDRMERKRDVSGLVEAVLSPKEHVAIRAIVALANVDPAVAREKLQPLLNDARPGLQSVSIAQYGRVADRNNVKPLVDLFRSPKDVGLKPLVAGALGDARGWEGVEVLLPAVNDPNPQLRRAAATALGKILGVELNLDSEVPAASRQKIIAKLHSDLPNFKKIYDDYWARNPRQENK